MNPRACRSCGAPIRWAVNPATGKQIPFDAAESPDGTHLLVPVPVGLDRADRWTAVYVPPARREAVKDPRFVSHFATCPDAAKFRGGGG